MISIFDLNDLYKRYFHNTPYYIAPKDSNTPLVENVEYSALTPNAKKRGTIEYNKNSIPFNKIGKYGQSIWFPVEFWKNDKQIIEIEVCTIAVNLSKTIIKTPVSERKGTVHECFAIDDYKFSIKGFLIGKNRKVPEDDIMALKELFETIEPVSLHGGYPELFLDESCQVVIETLEFPEVEGKSSWIRPFSLTCESDFIQDLELD